MSELKQCSCGGTPEIDVAEGGQAVAFADVYRVVCRSCGNDTPYWSVKAEAVDQWEGWGWAQFSEGRAALAASGEE